jgi:hypothetical protein
MLDNHKHEVYYFSTIYGLFNDVIVELGRLARQRSWLSHYATVRKVAGSIPDEVIGFFN